MFAGASGRMKANNVPVSTEQAVVQRMTAIKAREIKKRTPGFYEIRERMTSVSLLRNVPAHLRQKLSLGVPRDTAGETPALPLYISFAQLRVLAGEQFPRELIAALVRVVPGAGEIIVDPVCADREQ